MNTYAKIMATTLPLVFFFLFATVGISYYFSRTALIDLGETWLDTRLSEAMNIVETQEKMLHEYGLEKIPASMAKAKLDAATGIAAIGVGEQGYIFGVDTNGFIVFHPDKYLLDTDAGSQKWFQDLKSGKSRLILHKDGKPSLARFKYFKQWDWFILAVDPMQEVYGVSDRMKPYLFSLLIIAAITISLALMMMTRRLTRPLNQLVLGAEKIGKGNLDTRIPIQSNDEFGHLAMGFNQMALRLQETLTALQYSEEHFRALIENANDQIWILDNLGNFLYVSPSTRRILGYAPKELLGVNAFDLVHPDDKAGLLKRFNQRIQGKLLPQPTEHRLRHKQGYWCTLESISKNLLEHPAIKGIVINSRNISKRKMAEEALRLSHQELEKRVEERTCELLVLNKALNLEIEAGKQKEIELKKANQAKSQFLANMSHEIRTPLNSVIGFSELLSTMISDPQQSSYLNAITSAGKNLLGLINDILDLSKIEAGKLEIQIVPTSLDLVFNETRRLFNVRLREKSLELISEIDTKIPLFLGLDDIRFRQILINLVDNAVKFTDKGMIRLSARAIWPDSPKNNCLDLVIRVEDTGLGIPDDKQDLIFKSFQQESAGTSRKFGGTGLGLSICKRLVKLMGGSINVTSTLNQGTVFEVFLPGVEVSKEPDKHKKPDPNKIKFSGKKSLGPDTSKHDFKRHLASHPQFIPVLKNQISHHLPNLEEGVIISDIQKLALEIIELGDQFKFKEFKEFGQELLQLAESFDIEKISLALKQLYTVLDNLG